MKASELISFLLEHPEKEVHVAGIEYQGREIHEAEMRPLRHVHTDAHNRVILLYDLEEWPEEE